MLVAKAQEDLLQNLSPSAPFNTFNIVCAHELVYANIYLICVSTDASVKFSKSNISYSEPPRAATLL